MVDAYVRRLLGNNETILFTTRQHWFLLVQEIFLELVLVGVIVFLGLLLLPVSPLFALAFILLIVPLYGLIRDILVFSSQQFLVTNRRVIHVRGVFHKTVMDSSLEKVNDVNMDQPLLGRLFDYGDVRILTASEEGVNVFKFIAKPIKLKTAMLNAKAAMSHQELVSEDYGNGQSSKVSPEIQLKQEVIRMIEELDDLRKKGIISEEEFRQKKAELLKRI